MTSPDSLAERLEKAREAVLNARAKKQLGRVYETTVAYNKLLAENFPAILAALRSSASAREVETLFASSNPRGLIGDVMDELWGECGGSHQSVEFWEDASSIAAIVIEFFRKRALAPPASPATLAEPEAEGA